MSTFQSLPGFREFYPEDCAARNGLFRAWRSAARRFGFAEYDAPVLEPLELYQEKSGEEIRQQLFEFTDKGGRNVALRPEMTPSLARLVAAKAGSLRKPLKWFSIGEMYRYEKPQKGRGRSFYQFNADILGEPGPAADAECIALLVEALKFCGLKEGEFEVRISDRKLWSAFFDGINIVEKDKPAMFSIVDKWDREPREKIIAKLAEFGVGYSPPDIIRAIDTFFKTAETEGISGFKNLVSSESWANRLFELKQLTDSLGEFGLKSFIRFDPRIVRGLAYYTGFVFEAFQTVGTARALAGGGRYDDLLMKLGGVDMPAVGFGMGDMTVSDLLAELKRPLSDEYKLDVYFVIGSDKERPAALQLVAQLRGAGLSVDYPLKTENAEDHVGKIIRKGIKTANQTGARLALILGADEAAKGEVKIKDMNSSGEKNEANNAELTTKIRSILASGLPKAG